VQWRDHAATLGRAARATVEERYSYERMVGAFESLYTETLQARHGVAAPAEMIAS
jgi:hypothetical protein